MHSKAINRNYARGLRYALLFFCIISSASGYKKPSVAKKVYFLPVGKAPISQINDLVGHYREKFQLEIQVLPPMAPGDRDFDSDRQQLIAENVIQSMLRHYPQYARSESAVLIGITGQDHPVLARFVCACFLSGSSTGKHLRNPPDFFYRSGHAFFGYGLEQSVSGECCNENPGHAAFVS